MTEYELVHEIQNLCPNNQMRDVFFEEVECESPEGYVHRRYGGRETELTVVPGSAGALTIHAVIDGLMHKFVFTPI